MKGMLFRKTQTFYGNVYPIRYAKAMQTRTSYLNFFHSDEKKLWHR